jgi:ABC-type phosphate transport system permease subunit
VTATALPARLVRSRDEARRARRDRLMRGVAFGAAMVGVIPLLAILAFVTINGFAALNLDLLTKPPLSLGVGVGALIAI